MATIATSAAADTFSNSTTTPKLTDDVTTTITTPITLEPLETNNSKLLDTQDFATGLAVRLAARSTAFTTPTSGLAPSHLQANLIVLPSALAPSFTQFCLRNPVPCPLLATSSTPGSFTTLTSHIPSVPGAKLAADLDLRHDCPRYNVYRSGRVLAANIPSVEPFWDSETHVAFLLGCSFSFEAGLARAGLTPTNVLFGRNVSMYATGIRLADAGVFRDRTAVVSMRPYRASEVQRVKEITGRYGITHGEPLCWGWDAAQEIGIRDLGAPEFGDAPVDREGRVLGSGREDGWGEMVPVFWGCGVTPWNAVMGLDGVEGVVIGHAPGHMLVLDVREEDVFGD